VLLNVSATARRCFLVHSTSLRGLTTVSYLSSLSVSLLFLDFNHLGHAMAPQASGVLISPHYFVLRFFPLQTCSSARPTNPLQVVETSPLAAVSAFVACTYDLIVAKMPASNDLAWAVGSTGERQDPATFYPSGDCSPSHG
jgi:hypothetical protein